LLAQHVPGGLPVVLRLACNGGVEQRYNPCVSAAKAPEITT